MSEEPVLATIQASPGRRWLGVLSMAFLGGLLIWVAFARPPALGWQAFLLLLGLGSLWLARRMYHATALILELTDHEIRDSSGARLVTVADIVQIDRGFFAFKPSNGLLLYASAPSKAVWQPGLWWRMGKRIGIGGMTPGHQSKAMAEIIAIKLAQRASSD